MEGAHFIARKPDYQHYSYRQLRDVAQHVDGDRFPERKAEVLRLLQERFPDGEPAAAEARIGKYQTFWPRFWAAVFDLLLLTAVGAGLAAIISLLPEAMGLALMIISGVLPFVYLTALHQRYGQTVGKKWLQLRLVRAADEGPVSRRQAQLRDGLIPATLSALVGIAVMANLGPLEIGKTAWALMLLSFGLWHLLELASALFSRQRRSLQDRLAGTAVINIGAHVDTNAA